MRPLIILLAAGVAAGCSRSTRSRARASALPETRIADTMPARHADVDLTGTWTTGSTGEPAAKQLVFQPQCNAGPAHWIIEQRGDTVRRWEIPEIQAQGTASTVMASSASLAGRVSGFDLVMGGSGTRYLLHYDSTSGHLRGTLNGAPFWAVRLQIVEPQGCMPVP